tara:strand:+ start:646 stop:1593 length:948 start_codon:yes stop_codon:yes gene_type:complete
MRISRNIKGGVGNIPENIYSTREENIKKKKWIYNMLASSQNRKIIEKELTVDGVKPSEEEVQKLIDERWRNLRSVSVSMADKPIGPTWDSIYGEYIPEKSEQLQNLIARHKRIYDEDITIEEAEDLWKKLEREGRTGKEHSITLQPQEREGYKEINLEEYLHAVKGGPEGGRIPKKTLDLIDKHAAGGIDSKYETIPDEFTAQFNAVKYKMQEEGLFNPIEEDFTEEHYDKLMKGDHKIRESAHFMRMMESLKYNYDMWGFSEDYYGEFGNKKQKEKLKNAVIKLMNNISVRVDEPRDDKQTWASIGKEAYMGGV